MKLAQKQPIMIVPDPLAAMPNDPDSDVMTLPEAAAFLLCHPETVKSEARKGKVPHFRMGTGWRFSRIALTRYTQRDKAA